MGTVIFYMCTKLLTLALFPGPRPFRLQSRFVEPKKLRAWEQGYTNTAEATTSIQANLYQSYM